jgi:hypothetical protein
MNTTTRNDAHSPANFNPEHYEFLVAFDNGGDEESNLGVMHDNGIDQDIDALLGELEDAGNAGRVAYGDGSRCDHCGARIRYVGLFRHTPSGDVIAVGQTCAEGRMTYDKATFDRLRKQAQLDREAQRVLIEWNQFKADRPQVEWDTLAESNNEFIVDVLRKGRRNGNLSDRQVEAIVESNNRDIEFAAKRAEEAANALPTMSVPEGNGLVVEGKVLTTKWQESDYGDTLKMLVEVTLDGHTFKVWGSVPRAIDPQNGDVIRFTANFERSRDDQSFGFFKRPRKAEVLSSQEEAA